MSTFGKLTRALINGREPVPMQAATTWSPNAPPVWTGTTTSSIVPAPQIAWWILACAWREVERMPPGPDRDQRLQHLTDAAGGPEEMLKALAAEAEARR